MKCIKTPHFLKQLEEIEKKYRRVRRDIDVFAKRKYLTHHQLISEVDSIRFG